MFKKNWILFFMVEGFGIFGFAIFLIPIVRSTEQSPDAINTLLFVSLLFGSFMLIGVKMYLVNITEKKVSIFGFFKYKHIRWKDCSKELLISAPRTIVIRAGKRKYSLNLMVFSRPDEVLFWIQKHLHEVGK